MEDKLTVFVLGDYRPGSADGLAEFSYQNVKLLKDLINFQFIEFDHTLDQDHYSSVYSDDILIHRFGSKNLPLYKLSGFFKLWMKDLPQGNAVFHLNHIYNINNYLVARILNRSKIPYLITPHDSYVYCREFKSKRSFIKRLYRNIFVHFIDKYVLDHASLIHGLSDQCSPCLRLLSRSPVMVVANQVNDMQLDLNMKEIKARVCFIGRSDIYQKGIDRALEGFKLFRESPNGPDGLNFTLVGPSDEASDALRHKLCRQLGLEIGKDVTFAGKVEEQHRNRILAESKVYLHLSRFEGFGLSVIQALSAYKPVIVSKQVPTNDKISAYKAGFVVDGPQETAHALADVFALSDDEYEQMARNARLCYEEQFHPRVIRPQLLELYRRAASLNKIVKN